LLQDGLAGEAQADAGHACCLNLMPFTTQAMTEFAANLLVRPLTAV